MRKNPGLRMVVVMPNGATSAYRDSSPLAVVPRGCFEGIEFCLRPNDQTRHLPTGAQALLDAVDDFLPGAGFVGSAAMCGKAVFEDQQSVLVAASLGG